MKLTTLELSASAGRLLLPSARSEAGIVRCPRTSEEMMELVFSLLLLANSSAGVPLLRPKPNAALPVSRVARVMNVGHKRDGDVVARVVVENLGGSTDVSPTLRVYFVLYHQAEMCDAEGAYDLGPAFRFISARRVSASVVRVSFETTPSLQYMKRLQKQGMVGDSVIKTVDLDLSRARSTLRRRNCSSPPLRAPLYQRVRLSPNANDRKLQQTKASLKGEAAHTEDAHRAD